MIMVENKVLPKEWQVRNIKKKLADQGVDPDLVDVEALVDPTLSYPENEEAVLSQYGTMSEEEMFEASAGGAMTEEIQNIKSKMVRRDEVERLVDSKLKKLMTMKEQVQRTVVTPENQAQVVEANKKINQEIVKTSQAKALLMGLKQNLESRYNRYKESKVIKSKTEVEKKLASMRQQQEFATEFERGQKKGTYMAGRRIGSRLAEQQFYYRQLMPQKTSTTQKIIGMLTGRQIASMSPMMRQQLAVEIAKERQKLLIKREMERQLYQAKMEQAQKEMMRKQMIESMKPQIQPRMVLQQMPQQPIMRPFNPLAPHPFLSEFSPRPIMLIPRKTQRKRPTRRKRRR